MELPHYHSESGKKWYETGRDSFGTMKTFCVRTRTVLNAPVQCNKTDHDRFFGLWFESVVEAHGQNIATGLSGRRHMRPTDDKPAAAR